LTEHDADVEVETYWRDHGSYVQRQSIDKMFPKYACKEFYPFKYVINSKLLDGAFYSDNCINVNNYNDRIDEWYEYYKACICVPIRAPKENGGKSKQLAFSSVGFLTIDNHKGNLEDKVSIDVSKAFADSLYNIFKLINYINNN
ncbi:MAG: hypothetical protein WBA74_10730, partial [Cyclobacteriaceae bacterium]